MSRMSRFHLHGLYAITNEAPDACELSDRVARALRGGARAIQYRDKSGDAARRLQEAEALRALCRAYNVPLIVNDDVELARAVGADGVHLGKDDASIAEARTALGAGAIIGVSCYNSLERALQADAAGADYVAFGSFFPSSTKPAAVRASLELLGTARAQIRLPIVAIGGITPENGAQLVAAGADMLAVIQGVFGAPDPEAAARRYAALF
ncbi:MAG: thiamine phosphate synthase [Gammaproteobacteria bacterium]